MKSEKPYDYDVAISFAGEDREHAEALANALKRRNIDVFYDKDRKVDLVGRDLLSQLPNIYEHQAQYCVLLLSRHYPEKYYTKIELRAAQARASRQEGYLVPIHLDDTPVPSISPNISYLSWPPENPETITDTLLTKMGRAPYWQIVSIQGCERDTTVGWNESWRDILWMGSEGWLCGAIEEGGGGGDVGRGILLHTTDEGASWTEVAKDAFFSGQGSFSWGPQGTRMYEWAEVGPVNAISMYRRLGKRDVEGWLASSTGVFYTVDGGATWQRSTPPPDHPDRYALFANIANIEAFSEIYAVGWQGIAHYSARGKNWELQLPTYFYNISGVFAMGGSENRSVWAVGRAGRDEQGHYGDRSHGAIYFLNWSTNTWKRIPLPGIEFLPGQALTDILVMNHDTVFAIGEKGLALRGSRNNGGNWLWIRLPTQTEENLCSIAYADYTLWIVGNGGAILKSSDNGRTWTTLLLKDGEEARIVSPLRRIRFFSNQGWIVGDRIVLKSVQP